jgi:NAD(P)-dependent dehydrogenase (short-subunit alcohol dehydrogenase family)
MTTLKDKVVALTGAASGIGRALASELAKKGAHLALSDIDATGLEAAAAEARALSATRVTTHRVDVSKLEAVRAYAASVEAEHGGADVIINNAGLAVRASLEEVTYEELDRVLGVDLMGVIYGCKEFLPLLRKRPEGHIVNISSINAFVTFTFNGPYNIAKYGVAGLSETLVQELAGSPIRVSCVHPGGVRTNIVRGSLRASHDLAADFDRIAMTSPTQAAQRIIRGIEKNQEKVFVGMDAKVMATAKRLFPNATVHAAGKLSRGPGSRKR